MAETKKKPTAKKSKAKPISDVAKPGKTAPSATSKAIITTHHTLLGDPMVTPTTAPELPGKGKHITPSSSAVAKPAFTAPLPVSLEEPTVAPVKKSKSDGVLVSELIKKTTTPPPVSEPKVTQEQSSEESQSEPAADPLAPAPDVDDAQAAHEQAIEKLIDSKQYYLPIETTETRRTKRFVVAGVLLSVLLFVSWADIALDAGLIHIANLKSVTHFFSN